jgi:zinc protease
MPIRACLAIAVLIFTSSLSFAGPAIQRVKSPGGIEAWLVEDHSVPVIALRMAFRGGSAEDPADRLGLANMTARMLDEGAGDLDAQAFRTLLDNNSIGLGFDDARDIVTGYVKTLSVNRALAFDLLALALTKPRFEAEALDRMRSSVLARLKRQTGDPDYLAGRLWWRNAFPTDAYGRPTEGTVESVSKIDAADLRGFVERRLARDNLVVGVVGDIKAEELAPALDRIFGGLPPRSQPALMEDLRPKTAGSIFVVDRENPQSVIVFGEAGLKRNDPDFYAALVMNHILGGGAFSSRLYREVRDKRGLAYSIYTYLNPMDEAGLIMGGVATENSRVGETIATIRDVWTAMAMTGATAKELGEAKSYLTGSFALQFDNTDQIARLLVSIQLDDLGIDYIDRRNGFIAAVSLPDVMRVARRVLDAKALTFAVVGQPQGLPANAVVEKNVE